MHKDKRWRWQTYCTREIAFGLNVDRLDVHWIANVGALFRAGIIARKTVKSATRSEPAPRRFTVRPKFQHRGGRVKPRHPFHQCRGMTYSQVPIGSPRSHEATHATHVTRTYARQLRRQLPDKTICQISLPRRESWPWIFHDRVLRPQGGGFPRISFPAWDLCRRYSSTVRKHQRSLYRAHVQKGEERKVLEFYTFESAAKFTFTLTFTCPNFVLHCTLFATKVKHESQPNSSQHLTRSNSDFIILDTWMSVSRNFPISFR